MNSLVYDELGKFPEECQDVCDLCCTRQVAEANAVPTCAAGDETLWDDGNSSWQLSNERSQLPIRLFGVARVHTSVQNLCGERGTFKS